jgi:glyoxylase-like metal-dependent hydrolase (beta-lactamase superfamily II)
VTLTPEGALEQAALAGIHRLRIPTPFAVGRVNCYLLEDEPLTLVDTGPNSGKALDELQGQLAARGHSIDDLELVILTHQHIDHLGLIAERPRSGYEVAQAIWGDVAVTQAFLTLSEVIGHADLLLNEGRVREVEDGEVVRYEATA